MRSCLWVPGILIQECSSSHVQSLENASASVQLQAAEHGKIDDHCDEYRDLKYQARCGGVVYSSHQYNVVVGSTSCHFVERGYGWESGVGAVASGVGRVVGVAADDDVGRVVVVAADDDVGGVVDV